MSKIVIQNGRVIDPHNSIDTVCDLVISKGIITRIGQSTATERKGAEIIDATGKIVCPGLIDLHVHTREPGHEEEETVATVSAAAVAGGFTTICAMPNTHPPIDNDTQIQFVLQLSDRANLARVLPTGCITRGSEGVELTEMGMMRQAGAVAFTDDGRGVEDCRVMQRALQYSAMVGTVLMQHCQEPSLFGGSMNSGAVAPRLGLGGIPASCEEIMLERDLELIRRTGGKYHAQHLSTAGSVELVRAAKANGLPVTAEVTPHHLLLTDAACVEYDSIYKVNPPLRTIEDIEALRRGVADGTIDCLATDHAPHTEEEKELEFALAPFGMISLEAALGLYIKALVDTSLCNWPALISRMTCCPASIIGSDLGTLGVGRPADVTVIDPKKRWTVRKDKFLSKSRNCPYEGWKLKGRAIMTIVNGDIKFCLGKGCRE